MSHSAWTPVDEKASAWTPVPDSGPKDWSKEPLVMSHPVLGQLTVPREKVGEYQKNGWQAGPANQSDASKNIKAANTANAGPQEGFGSSLVHAVGLPTTKEEAQQMPGQMLKKLSKFDMRNPLAVLGPDDDAMQEQVNKVIETGTQAAHDAAAGRYKDAGLGVVRATGQTAAGLTGAVGGLNLEKAGEQLGEGNVSGAAGTITGTVAPLLVGKGISAIASKHPVARALPGVSSEAAATATPHIQVAAADMGLDLTKASASDVLAAAKQAKRTVLLNAQESAGPGSTVFDLPEDHQSFIKQQIGHISEVEQAITKAQETAAKTPANTPASRGQAAVDVAKGAGKMAIADTVGRMIPGGRMVADAVGIGAGGGQVVRGLKGVLRPALTPEVLDSRLQNAFSKVEPSTVPGVPAETAQPASEWTPVDDATVQHTGVPSPPETAGGDAPVTPVAGPSPRRFMRDFVKSGEAGPSQASVQAPPEWQGPIQQREPIGEPTIQPAAKPEAQPRAFTPLKAKTPAAAQTEVLKKAGVAAPKATQRPFTGEVPGPVLQPREFESFPGADTGEKAALQSLTHYSINELRAIAQQRGIKVLPGDSHVDLIGKIHGDLTPEEVQHFHDAATAQETARQSPVGAAAQHPENKAIAQTFYDAANELEKSGGKPYDVAAYRTGARAIEDHPQPMSEMEPKDIQKIPGIGKKMSQLIQDQVSKNKPVDDLEQRLKQSVDAAKDTDMMAQARKELGADASLSSVARRAWELKFKPDASAVQTEIAKKQGTPVGDHLKDAFGDKISADEPMVQTDAAGKDGSGKTDRSGSGSGNSPKAPSVPEASPRTSPSGDGQGKASQNSASQLRAKSEDAFYSSRAKALLGAGASVEEIAVKAKELKLASSKNR